MQGQQPCTFATILMVDAKFKPEHVQYRGKYCIKLLVAGNVTTFAVAGGAPVTLIKKKFLRQTFSK